MNGKKRILIVNNNLDTGGVQKSLINLLNELNKEKIFNLDLFVFSKSGQYLDDIPKGINIIEGNKFIKILGVSQNETKKMGYLFYIIRAISVIYSKCINRKLVTRLILNTQKKLKNYDVAISFLHDPDNNTFYGGCNDFVINRVIANKKVAFVHCDFLNYGGNNKINRKIYSKFDSISTVSESCKKNFIKANPKLADRVYSVPNCTNYSEIISKSNENTIIYNNDSFNIITVARISKEKGFIRAINVLEKIVKKYDYVQWHIVGDGPLKKDIEELIRLKGLEKNIIMYGSKNNPYRYIKNADLFFLPSFHEAAPMVFNESKCLGVPILSTNTISSVELIDEPNIGWVCENSEYGIYDTMDYILKNRDELIRTKKIIESLVLDNKNEVDRFVKVMEG